MHKRWRTLITAAAVGVVTTVLGAPGSATASTVTAATTCPTGNASITNVSYILHGTHGNNRTVTTLWDNTLPGDHAVAKFKIANGCKNVQVSFVSYSAPDDVFDPATASQQRLYDYSTGWFSAGWHYLDVKIPKTRDDCVCHHGRWGWSKHGKWTPWSSSPSKHEDVNNKGEAMVTEKTARALGDDTEWGYKHHGYKHHGHPFCAEYYQVDFVRGAVIKHLGPEGSNNFYSAQGRLIDNDLG